VLHASQLIGHAARLLYDSGDSSGGGYDGSGYGGAGYGGDSG